MLFLCIWLTFVTTIAGELETSSHPIQTIQRIRRAAVDTINTKAAHSIYELPECQDLRSYCTHLKSTDNLSVLECALSFSSSQLEGLSDSCQHALWMQQRQLQSTDWIEHTLLPKYCSAEKSKFTVCFNAVDIWPCIDEQRQQLPQSSVCNHQIRRAYTALAPDYSSVEDFLTTCGSLVEQLHCGRMNVDHLPGLLSQLNTVKCLEEQTAAKTSIDSNCNQAMKTIQQQRGLLQMFQACTPDLQALCPQEHFGSPAAHKCLIKHKNNPVMTAHCAALIAQRDQQMGRDYRVSHGLAKACKDDIKLHHCRRGVSEDKQVRLAQILLCLESVAKNGTKLVPECLIEISDHRRMLMTDYQLSPELLNDCADDIPKFCPDQHKAQLVNGFVSTSGEIIHCLLEHVRARRPQRRLTAQCQRGLETLIKVSDAGEDWRVDPVLRHACKPVVDVACKDVEGGDARVMSCLMEHIGTKQMLPDCEQALLLIEYFVARDFKLDPQLYKHCRDDAIKYCHAKRTWDDAQDVRMDPERGPMILPCLHRMAYSDDEQHTLHKDCFREVKRVMRQRAISVDLMPEVEDSCLSDLSLYCSERTGKGAEMECLQNKLEELTPDCKAAVTKYTEEEAANIELNPVIMDVCGDAMQQHCAKILKSGNDKGEMMDCLISHKNDADLRKDLRCRAAIEHFQIISLKSYHFTYKFKEACRPYVSRFCAASATKNDVVACLSEVMRNDTIRAQRHQIPKECRQQVKSQLYQQRESILLDPKLANACRHELEEFCGDKKEPGQAVECLVQQTPRLGKACHHAIFMVKKSELSDSGTDYTLVNTCKEMTYKFCPKTDSTQLLNCLKTYKDNPEFDPRCHLVVVNRMIEQNTDFRFNPSLQHACGKNIDSYCSHIVAQAQPNEELNGKVIQCLKNKFRESRLDEECAQEMIKILQEQALNYKLNPLLQHFCKSEIQELCKANADTDDEHGQVAECLKSAFLKKQIINRECQMEVASLIAEAKADIHVDPILESACTVDLLRYCTKVASGNGRKLKCLRTLLKETPNSLDQDCREKLQRRLEMFRNAESALAQPPGDMQELVQQVVTSPARRFFLLILMTGTGMVFLMGIFLGRATKRAMSLKNK